MKTDIENQNVQNNPDFYFNHSILPLSKEVKKINLDITDDRNMKSKFEEIKDIFSKITQENWDKRVNCMHIISKMILDGYGSNSIFKEQLWLTADKIKDQLQDKRSNVCRTACSLVALLSRYYKENFENFADILIPAIFPLTIITVKIIADSGHNCIRQILFNSKINRCIPSILEGCQASHPNLRMCCVEYLFIILSHHYQALSKYNTNADSIILLALEDGHPTVRRWARDCILLLKEIDSSRYHDLFSRCSSNIQHLLDKPSKSLVSTSILRHISTQNSKHSVTKTPSSISSQESSTSHPGNQINSTKKPLTHTTSSFSHLPLSKNKKEKKFEGLVMAKPQRLEKISKPQRNVKPKEKENISSPNHHNPPSTTTTTTIPSNPTTNVNSHHSYSISDILNFLLKNSSDWSGKIQYFQHLSTFISHSSFDLYQNHLESIIKVLESGLLDNHFKVCLSSFDLFYVLVENCPSHLSSYLPRLIPSVILYLHHPRNVLQSTVEKLWPQILKSINFESVVNALLSIFSHNNIKIKTNLLMVLSSLLSSNPSPFDQHNSVLKSFISKIMNINIQQIIPSGITPQFNNLQTLISSKYPQIVQESLKSSSSKTNHSEPTNNNHSKHLTPASNLHPNPNPDTCNLNHNEVSHNIESNINNSSHLDLTTTVINSSNDIIENDKKEIQNQIEEQDVEINPILYENIKIPKSDPENKVSTNENKVESQRNEISDMSTSYLTNSFSLSSNSNIHASIIALSDRELNITDRIAMVDRALLLLKRDNQCITMEQCQLMVESLVRVFENQNCENDIREVSLFTLTELSRLLSQYFSTHQLSSFLIETLLSLQYSNDSLVKDISEEAFFNILPSLNLQTVTSSLVDHIIKEDIILLRLCLDSIIILFKQHPKSNIELCHKLMPYLVKTMANPYPDIRKSTVYCIVTIYSILGESINSYLSLLASNQLRLVMIYIQKETKKSNIN